MEKSMNAPSDSPLQGTMRKIIVFDVVASAVTVWLCIFVALLLTIRQYAQKNLEFLALTVSRCLKVALVTRDDAAANETLSLFSKQGQLIAAKVLDVDGKELIYRDTNRVPVDMITHWLYPQVNYSIFHNDIPIGELHLRVFGTDENLKYFVRSSLAVLIASILLSTGTGLVISGMLHRHINSALQSISHVIQDIRTNRNFSRRVTSPNMEFNLFAQHINSLLDAIDEWERQQRLRTASLQRAALHDDLTGLSNRAAFRRALRKLLKDADALRQTALLFMDGDNFKFVNDSWGHAAGDAVLVEIAKRMLVFANQRHLVFRLGGDEFAMLLFDVNSYSQMELVAQIKKLVEQPIKLQSGHWVKVRFSMGVALASGFSSAKEMMETADRNMYIEKYKSKLIKGQHNRQQRSETI